MVPALELDVNPVRNGQNLAQRTQLRSGSESWWDEVPDDLRIEGVPCYADSRVTHDAARGLFFSTNIGTNVNQGEVACSTAKIADENEFVVIECGTVIMRRGYRLHLELYRLVAGGVEGGSESIFRINIVLGFLCSYKMNRPSGDCGLDFDPKLFFRLGSQVAQNSRDQILNHVLSPEKLGAVKGAATQKRLERLNQPTLCLRREIPLNGLRT